MGARRQAHFGHRSAPENVPYLLSTVPERKAVHDPYTQARRCWPRTHPVDARPARAGSVGVPRLPTRGRLTVGVGLDPGGRVGRQDDPSEAGSDSGAGVATAILCQWIDSVAERFGSPDRLQLL